MKFSYGMIVGGVSLIALSPSVYGQGRPPRPIETEEVVVTGSRVITNGNLAPTPVTVLDTEKLLQTTPTNIPDALNNLPLFATAPAVRNIGAAGSNSTGAYLNLRRFGSQRNLILVDGSRVPPTAANGTVDTNIIPQSLVQRVDVVTGGGSAVYGSDAITGVINFIIDRNFNGLKFNSQAGISGYGDNGSWRIGGAAGMPLFGGRGHIEASFDHYHSNGIFGLDSRPEGVTDPAVGGQGTAANPFRLIQYGRLAFPPSPTPPVGLRDLIFKSNGVATPFVHGQPTGVFGLESGGDGTVLDVAAIVAPLGTNQAFMRFDYDLPEDVHAFVQTSFADSQTYFPYFSAAGVGGSIASGNPFLPASFQQIMTATNTPFIAQPPTSRTAKDGYPAVSTAAYSANIFIKTGLEGKIFNKFSWNANYGFSRSTQHVTAVNNRRADKSAAALDAVINPANGQIVCAVSLTSFASRFPGCEPINPFGPTALTKSALDWVLEDTHFTLANEMHDANVSISGPIVALPAGDVVAAVSGEYRALTLNNNSDADPTALADCTGLRVIGTNCTATTLLWNTNTTRNISAEQNVKEVAAELLIPVLSGLPMINSFDVNLAYRYTDYSTSGSVETWKAGFSWQLAEGLRLRGTASRDIRAPTLQDLFAPLSTAPFGYTDLHTGVTGLIQNYTQGNPKLVPELARTDTLGIVYQPGWLPNFSLAIDYYSININNAITSVSASNQNVQLECEKSNGASPYCALYDRPLPFSDHSPANFPTRVFSQSVNAARTWTRGVDVEANYRFDLAELDESVPGSIVARWLVSYQPILKSQNIRSLPATQSAGINAGAFGGGGASQTRMNLNVSYMVGGLNVSVAERWQSGQWPSDPTQFVDLRPRIPAYLYTDISASYRTEVAGTEIEPFITVQNLTDTRPPVVGTLNSSPGLFFPSAAGYDIIGRYFTVGIRGRL